MIATSIEIFPMLPAAARVWIYTSDRIFTPEEAAAIQSRLDEFAGTWVSHARDLTAAAKLLHQRFVVLAVDESRAGASGCSIDSSVRFLQDLGATYQVDLFNRMLFSFQNETGVHTLPADDFRTAFAKNEINEATLVFDTLINTVGDMRTRFLVPLADSWLTRMV